jgi:Raf kinase inhibitor-like YbhB/YbcL family protein
MRASRWLIAAALACGAPLSAQAPAARPQQPARPPFTMEAFQMVDGGLIPYMFTQAAYENEYKPLGASPRITWTNPPPGTQSFVLHFHDMDVARNKTTEDQLHWLVWNIPATDSMIPFHQKEARTLPNGAFQINGQGTPVYRGPGAPYAGAYHHYMFELIALDTKLNVQPAADGFATRKQVMDAAQGHVLGKALFVGMFKRPPPLPPTH